MSDSTADTLAHIDQVRRRINEVRFQLGVRAQTHDASKLEEPEKSGFDVLSAQLAELEYGSDAYKQALVDAGPTIQHHYAHNRHHPEHTRTVTEEWRSVVGFEGHYEVSNFGEVRSVDRVVRREGKQGDLRLKGQAIVPHPTPKGYLRCQLRLDGKTSNKMVHRLVAEAFIPNPEARPEVNHRNGVKQDNHVDNLEWATPSENQVHAYALGLRQATIKYVVHCVELNITTFGIEAMVNTLRERGYEKASSGAIWNCIAGDSTTHLDLTFISWNLEEYKPMGDLRFMTLIDVIEMLCDWKAASARTRQGSIAQSLAHNKERFGIADQLAQILENTVKELDW